MIWNLNQVNFRGFGTILPERAPADRQEDTALGTRHTLRLKSGCAQSFRTCSETWICCCEGATILSLSSDGESFRHFYLDKPVFVNPGILVSLSALPGESTAVYAAETPPETVESSVSAQDFLLRPKLTVSTVYTFFYQEKERGFLFPGESHSMWELTYVDQGSLHSVADGQDLLLQQGEMVLYGPQQWHMQYADIGVAPRFVTISFDLTGEQPVCLLGRKFRSPQRAVPLIQQMLQEQERSDPFASDMILHLLATVLLTLLRESDVPAEKLRTARALHSENEIIRRAQQYISTHIRDKLSVPTVARSVDISPSYLTALFHKNLQISPGEYIRRIKLQESKQMIRENSMNFTEIAAALNYSTVHHFSRQFKEKFGITPTEYAKSVR